MNNSDPLQEPTWDVLTDDFETLYEYALEYYREASIQPSIRQKWIVDYLTGKLHPDIVKAAVLHGNEDVAYTCRMFSRGMRSPDKSAELFEEVMACWRKYHAEK